jgi:hypothetical protein
MRYCCQVLDVLLQKAVVQVLELDPVH